MMTGSLNRRCGLQPDAQDDKYTIIMIIWRSHKNEEVTSLLYWLERTQARQSGSTEQKKTRNPSKNQVLLVRWLDDEVDTSNFAVDLEQDVVEDHTGSAGHGFAVDALRWNTQLDICNVLECTCSITKKNNASISGNH